MNTKLHAICDSQGHPLNLFVIDSKGGEADLRYSRRNVTTILQKLTFNAQSVAAMLFLCKSGYNCFALKLLHQNKIPWAPAFVEPGLKGAV